MARTEDGATPAGGSASSPMSASNPMSAGQWGVLIILSAVWGATFLLVKLAVTDIPPLTLVLLRVSLGGAVLLAYLWVRRQAVPWDSAALRAYLILGLTNNVIPFGLIFWGTAQIDSGLAAILNAATPFFTALIAHAATQDDRLTPLKLGGILVGASGVVVLIGADALQGLGHGIWAEIAILCGTFSYGAAAVYARRTFRTLKLQPTAAAGGQLVAAALIMLPLVLVLDRPWTLAMPGAVAWGAVAGLAVFSTAFAYILYFHLLAKAGATNASLVTLLIPINAIMLGALVLGESLSAGQGAGMALVAFGLLLVDGRVIRLLKGRGRSNLPGRSAAASALDRR